MKTPSQYDNDNPLIWKAFKKFTLQEIAAGKKHYSSKSIFERIRWETEIEAKEDRFKINNNYTPYYARKFELLYPEHKDFFHKRESIKVKIKQ